MAAGTQKSKGFLGLVVGRRPLLCHLPALGPKSTVTANAPPRSSEFPAAFQLAGPALRAPFVDESATTTTAIEA